MRASDSDRELVAEHLRHAAADGRLLPHELEDRVGSALSARTYGELDCLVSDLPARVEPQNRGARLFGGLTPAVIGAVAVALVLMLIGGLGGMLATHPHPEHHWGGGGAGGASVIWLVVWIAIGWRFLSRRHRSQ